MKRGQVPRFAHLHVHTHYSLLDATIQVPELARQVADLGMESVAITDHGNLFGAFQFHNAAVSEGLRPVIGCEVYVAPGDHRERSVAAGRRKPYDHLVLLARNQEGYKNLVWLVSEAYLHGFYHKPRISKEILAEHSRGLIGLSACLSGEVAARLIGRDPASAQRAAEEYAEILGKDDYFLEIQDHGYPDEEVVRDGVARISETTGIPLVATNDCHFHRREDTFAHRVLLGIGLNKTLDELQRSYAYNAEFYLKSPQEMYELFKDYPGACERTVEIAERCHVRFDTSTMHLPSFSVPAGQSPASYLEEVALQGLEQRLAAGRAAGRSQQEYSDRLQHELRIIDTMGFPGYFLVVWDFIRFAKEQGVPVGPGRGSAAGSLVSYALGITDIDPLEYDLLFERFLNPDRISMPDIDIDFCQRRRDEVIDYVRKRYGEESVSQIATFNILKAKSAVRDVGRVMGMPFGEVDRIAKLIPDDLKITMERALQESPQLRELVDGDPDVRQLVETAGRLEGMARHCGVHAAGVVIANEPLTNLVPLIRTSHGEVSTQFDKDDVETLGLLKMDFLGLRTLTVLADAVQSVQQATGEKVDLQRLPLDDPQVFELFSAGHTDGIFQFESAGMKEVLRKVQPQAFPDLAALNALYRPGPMQFIDDYSERRHGSKPITYIFPELEEILGETYGIIVYQEQVMQIAVKIAGFSLAKADTLRKAMGKKKHEIIEREAENFVKGAIANGFAQNKVRQLWDQIKPFAEYGFNKSHSVAYAYVAYLTAYLKTHYPNHFMAAMLTSEASNTDKLAQYMVRCRQMGITILPPDISDSQVVFTADGDGIRFGLSAIKGVGLAAVEPILAAREREAGFRSVSHCLRSLPARAVNHKVVDCLARAGCFDAFGLTRRALVDNLERLMEMVAREREQNELGQGFLFDDMPSESFEEELRSVAEAEQTERLAWERDVLGFYLSGHPLDRYQMQVERFADCVLAELGECFAAGQERATVGGLITGLRAMPIKRDGPNHGRLMASFQLEDRSGSVRVVAFPDVYERFASLLSNDQTVLLTANLKGDGDHVELLADEAVSLDRVEARMAAELRVVLDLEYVDQGMLEEIKEFLLTHPGDLPVRFELRRRGAFRAMLAPPPPVSVDPSPGLRGKLRPLLKRGWCEYIFAANGGNGNGRVARGSAAGQDDAAVPLV